MFLTLFPACPAESGGSVVRGFKPLFSSCGTAGTIRRTTGNLSRGSLSVETKNRVVRIRVQLGHMRAEGVLEVPPSAYRGRVLDYLNGAPDFLALTDVALWETGEDATSEPVECDVVLLRKSAIEFAIPLTDLR